MGEAPRPAQPATVASGSAPGGIRRAAVSCGTARTTASARISVAPTVGLPSADELAADAASASAGRARRTRKRGREGAPGLVETPGLGEEPGLVGAGGAVGLGGGVWGSMGPGPLASPLAST